MTRPVGQVVITGWGVISPIGIGVEAFGEGLRAGRSGLKTVEGYPEGALPFAEACVIPEFDASAFLGKKGTRFLDRTTLLAVSAVGMALQHSGLALTDENRARVGVVLGTNVGSIKSIGDFMRDTLIHERPYLVNPMHFPNSVMNCAAGQSAIWHKLKGVNATISGGRLAGLMALRYAWMALRLGYADALVTGSVEEFCEQTAWGLHHAGRIDPDGGAPLGEGCAVFILEMAEAACAQGRRALAEVLACEVGVYSPDAGERARQAQGLAGCIRRALSRAGVGARDVWAVSTHQFADAELEEVEIRALELALDGHVPARQVAVGKSVGECFSAAGAFQLAALLALFGDSPGDRVALVTSLAHSGAVGCAVIREGGPWLE